MNAAELISLRKEYKNITSIKDVSFTIPLPYFVISKLGISRSSGRIIWLPCLMSMTLTLWVCTKLNKKALLVSMIIAE